MNIAKKLSIFLFVIGFLLLGGEAKEVKAEDLRCNYSREEVTSYQGCSGKKGYYGRVGYINIWDADRSNKIKQISYSITKNGQEIGSPNLGSSNSYTAGNYINWCAFPVTIYGSGDYVANIRVVTTDGTEYSGEYAFYIYDLTPVVSSHPLAQSVKEGTMVSFSTSLSQGTNVSYQWQYSSDGGSTYTSISGATSSSYTIYGNSVTSSLNGRFYRCRLDNNNDEGTYVYTSAAKLTVYSAPTVSTPTAKSVKSGTSATFSVSASGGYPTNYTYQWYYATSSGGTGIRISGATSSSYTITSSNMTASLNGRYYYCVVSNGQYDRTSGRAKLTVYSAPSVTITPSSVGVREGASTSFSVSASGGNPSSYTYQWYYASSQSGTGIRISGATSSSYTISSSDMTPSLNGRYYYCVVSNGQYDITSNRTKLSVYYPPTVTAPVSLSVTAGTAATFSVSASGGNPSNYNYQWYYASSQSGTGTEINGATSSSYTISSSNMTSSLNGRYYYCVISTGWHDVTSDRAKLTVYSYSAPNVIAPDSRSVKTGNSATFSVIASGGYPSNYTYQWYYAASQNGTGTRINGATSSTYTVASSSVTEDLNGRYYYCVVSNGQYGVTSGRAKLTVYSAPSVAAPSDRSAKTGNSATFSVTASGGNPTSYTYQWYYATSRSGSGTRISGATSSSYTITSSNMTESLNGRYYYCMVSNGQYEVASSRARLTVQSDYGQEQPSNPSSPPTVSGLEEWYSVAEGTSLSLAVTASGGNPVSYTYQWYYALSETGTRTRISGATSSGYTIPSSEMTMSNHGRYYFCVVSNGAYSVESRRTRVLVHKEPDGSQNGGNQNTGAGSHTANGPRPQNINAVSRTVAYSKKAFPLGASTDGDGALTYRSSNPKVAAVLPNGSIKMKNYGTTVITISASQTASCAAAVKQVTVQVVPKKGALKKAASPYSRWLNLAWKKDKKAKGYEVQISPDKLFRSNTYKRTYPKGKTSATLIGLQSKKKYYVRVRLYAKAGKKKVYGEWSKVRTVNVR